MNIVPTCIISSTSCEKVCIHNVCNISPFICSQCPKNSCEKLHNHSGGLNIIYWGDLTESIEKINRQMMKIDSEINTKHIGVVEKQYLKLKGSLDLVNSNFHTKINELKQEKSLIKKEISQTKIKIDQNKSAQLTGVQIRKFYNEITNNTYLSNDLEIQIESQSKRMLELYKMINAELDKFNNVKKKIQNKPASQIKQKAPNNNEKNSVILKKTISVSNIQRIEQQQQQLKQILQRSLYTQREDRLKTANNHFSQKKYDYAEILYQQLLSQDPLNLEIKWKIAQIKFNKRQYEEAIEQCNSILEKDDTNHQCYFLLGQTYEKIKDKQLAITYYLKALNNSNKNMTYLQKIVDHYMKQKDYAKAKQFLDKILQINFNYDNLIKRMKLFKELKDYNNAQKDIATLIAKFPTKYEVYYQSGQLFEKMGKKQDALDEYTKGIAQGSQLTCFQARGILNIELQFYQKSIADFNKYINKKPDNSNIYYLKAVAQKLMGKYTQALVDIQHAVEMNLKYKYIEQKLFLEEILGFAQKAENTRAILLYYTTENILSQYD